MKISDLKLLTVFLFALLAISLANTHYFDFQSASKDYSTDLNSFKPVDARFKDYTFSPLDKFQKIEIEILPEFIRALNSAVPEYNGGVLCQKVRFKWVPVKSLKINGKTLNGRYKAKYRGYCYKHWVGNQKSYKIKVIDGEKMLGRNTLNINAMNTDPEQFEPWSMYVFEQLGGITSRLGYADFYINGEYDGTRHLIENLDQDLILSHGYPKGAIYREITHAYLGFHGRNIKELRRFWQKNSMANSSWGDWSEFNYAIQVSHQEQEPYFLKYLDIEHYLNYLAFTSLIGTNHVNTHNIPFYRPKDSAKFIPLGYDFDSPYMGLYSNNFSAFQMPYMSLNLLNELVYSNDDLRRLYHANVAVMIDKIKRSAISDYEKIIDAIKKPFSGQIISKKILDLSTKENLNLNKSDSVNYAERLISGRIPVLKKRFSYIYKMYHQPVLRVQDDWRNKRRFQFYIEGLGQYELDTTHMDGKSCQWSETVKIWSHTSDEQVILECVDNKYVGNKIILERNDINYPRNVMRNSMGGILAEVFKDGPTPLSKNFLKIKSMQTGRALSEIRNWPFQINPTGQTLKFDLLDELTLSPIEKLEHQTNTYFVGIPTTEELSSNYINGEYRFKNYIEPRSWQNFTTPYLCYNYDGSKNCLNFNFEFIHKRQWMNPQLLQALSTKRQQAPVKKNFKTVTQEQADNCKIFEFTSGFWHFEKSISFNEECQVKFLPGAILMFGTEKYMIVNSEPEFTPMGDPIVFTALNRDWGGLVIKNASDVYVANAIFEKSNEFMVGGHRYTGALTIVKPDTYLVEDNIFIKNYGDDGLNIKGGNGKILNNFFEGNKDALDVDIGYCLIKNNLILNSKDDGMDSGTATLDVEENIILSSGDKAVSVGEGSTVTVRKNFIKQNNVGIAVKDNSKGVIDKNHFHENQIALSIYNKFTKSFNAEETTITGESYFSSNKVDFKYNQKVTSIDSYQQNIEADFSQKLLNKIMKSCAKCLMMIKGMQQ